MYVISISSGRLLWSLNDLRDIDSDNSYAVESEFSNSDNIQIIGTDSSNIV